MCEDPRDVFKFMAKQGIGQNATCFYEAYAFVLEMCEQYSDALQVLEDGSNR